jgi:DNA-binding CsgD family transcriptional regulator
MRLGVGDTVRVLEATYRVEQPEEAWLKGVLEAVTPVLGTAGGVSAFFLDLSCADEFRASGYVGNGIFAGESARQRFAAWERGLPTALKRGCYLVGPCNYASTHPLIGEMIAAMPNIAETVGAPEMFGVNAVDATGLGLTLQSAQPLRVPAPTAGVAGWARVAAHLAAGLRLLRRLRAQGPAESPAAVLSPSGRVEHAEGDARNREAREILRHAAVGIDRARTRGARLDESEVTRLWRALIRGRWTLVDEFERGGRRYFVAHNNSPQPSQPSPLSDREAQVTSLAALGHSNKLIAYELGISSSSVATCLARAAAKLGVGSRLELITAYLASGR